jgi:membrane protease YdiL (CAAX protease family)
VSEFLTSVLAIVAAYLLTALLFAGPMFLAWCSLSPPRRLLAPWRPRAIPWADHPYAAAAAVFCFLLGPQIVASFVLGSLPKMPDHDSIEYERLGLIANLAGAPLQVLLMVGVLVSWAGAQPYQMGLTTHRLAANALLGFCAWAIILLPVLLFAGGLELLYEKVLQVPVDHHSLEKLAKGAGWADWVMLVLAAAVAAPIVEELLFRGIIQPWLVRNAVAADTFVGISFAMAVGFRADKIYSAFRARAWYDLLTELHPAIFVILASVVYLFLRLRARRSFPPLPTEEPAISGEHAVFSATPRGADGSSRQESSATVKTLPLALVWRRTRSSSPWRAAVWNSQALAGIWSASLLFAVFHTAVWPSPVPLLGLALVLGGVAYRTQSLVPSIVLHSAFNTVAIIMLVFQVWFGTASSTP